MITTIVTVIDSLKSIRPAYHCNIDVISVIFNIITIFVGIYIAHTVNKNISTDKSQKQLLITRIELIDNQLHELDSSFKKGSVYFEDAVYGIHHFSLRLKHIDDQVTKGYRKKSMETHQIIESILMKMSELNEIITSVPLDDGFYKAFNNRKCRIIIIEIENLSLELQISINQA